VIVVELATLKALIELCGELNDALEDASDYGKLVDSEGDAEEMARKQAWDEAGNKYHHVRALKLAREALEAADELAECGLEAYDAYEIGKCHEFEATGAPDGIESYFERCDEPGCEGQEDREDHKALRTVFTVYGHMPGRGVEAISDHETMSMATEQLSRMVGRRVVAEPRATALIYRMPE